MKIIKPLPGSNYDSEQFKIMGFKGGSVNICAEAFYIINQMLRFIPNWEDRKPGLSYKTASDLEPFLNREAAQARKFVHSVNYQCSWDVKTVTNTIKRVTKRIELIEQRDGPDADISISLHDAIILRDMARSIVPDTIDPGAIYTPYKPDHK